MRIKEEIYQVLVRNNFILIEEYSKVKKEKGQLQNLIKEQEQIIAVLRKRLQIKTDETNLEN